MFQIGFETITYYDNAQVKLKEKNNGINIYECLNFDFSWNFWMLPIFM